MYSTPPLTHESRSKFTMKHDRYQHSCHKYPEMNDRNKARTWKLTRCKISHPWNSQPNNSVHPAKRAWCVHRSQRPTGDVTCVKYYISVKNVGYIPYSGKWAHEISSRQDAHVRRLGGKHSPGRVSRYICHPFPTIEGPLRTRVVRWWNQTCTIVERGAHFPTHSWTRLQAGQQH